MSKAKYNPQQHSEQYRQEQAQEQPEKQQEDQQKTRPPESKRTPAQWDSLIDQRINEAMQRGDFDNLRNKGKPLNTAPDPYVPPDMQMANSLLKNNNLTPAWISDRGVVLAAIEQFRDKLRTIRGDFAQARAAAATPERVQYIDELWQSYVAAWGAEIVELNRRILTQNLKQPVTFLEIFPLRLEDELRRAGR